MFQGRTNIILAVSQFGNWIEVIKDNIVKSFDYGLFVIIIIKIISCAGYDIKNQVEFIQD